MNQAQRASVITAALVLLVAVIPVLYYGARIAGRRQWKAFGPRRRLLFVVCHIGWISWIAFAKVIRPWAAAIRLDGHWTLSVAPSFMAGITATAYAALLLDSIRQHRLLIAFVCGAAIMLLVEAVQLWLPKYVFDPLDVLAGTCGAALIVTVLYRYELRHPETG